MNRGLDCFSVNIMTDDDAPAMSLMRRQLDVNGDFANVSSDITRSCSLQNFIRDPLQRFTSPTHRNADLAGIEHGIIVLGVADSDTVVQRQPERIQRLAQASRFIDPLGQNHDTAVIELKDERQFELPDHLQDFWCGAGIRFDDAIAEVDLNLTRAKLIEQELRWRMR